MSSMLSPAVLFRRRSGWEATDMGILLWRTNCFPILFFTGIPLIIFFITFQITIKLELDWFKQIMLLVIWWIKPLLDRFCLHVVSVRFFEPHASFRRLFRGLGRTIRTGLADDLLWRRLSPFRSARMPLRVLEHINGSNYKRRVQLLSRNGLGFGLPLTLICIGIVMALNMGELLFLNSIFNMVKGTNSNIIQFINEENNFVSALYLINAILIETLYITMGFSLYINSRVETEGWDIELLFKTCVEKNKKSKVKLVVPVLILLFFFSPGAGYASENSSLELQKPEWLKPPPVSEKTGNTLNKILDDPKFGTAKESRSIQFKQSNEVQRGFTGIPLKETLGKLLRFFVIAAALTALGCGLFYAYRHRSRFFPGHSTGKSNIYNPAREECHTLLQCAEELHNKGRIREAWAMCFRAFISIFAKIWFIPFPSEATEYESLTIVRKNTAAETGIEYFENFVQNWIIFAYGGQKPASGSFEQALASCRTLLENNEDNQGGYG